MLSESPPAMDRENVNLLRHGSFRQLVLDLYTMAETSLTIFLLLLLILQLLPLNVTE
jgi:hypothetical protein